MRKQYTIKATCYDRKGRVLSVAYNNTKKSHPEQKQYALEVGLEHKIYLHAEIYALIKLKGRSAYRIKVERYNNDQTPACAKPCKVCQQAIKQYKIKVIEHT